MKETRKPVDKAQHPVHERLNLLITQLANGVQARFAERIGVPTGTIGDMLGKKKAKPGFELIGKILIAYPEMSERWLLIGEGEMLKPGISIATQEISLRPLGQTGVYTRESLSAMPVIELRHVSFKARAGFHHARPAHGPAGSAFDTVLFRLPPGRSAADYAEALVFDIENDSMEPSLRDGQQVIAWPVAASRWEYLHNTICLVDYAQEVTIKAILKNDLRNTDGLTLHATGGAGGSFTVARQAIHAIWEVREFYGVVPVRLLP